MSFKAIQHFQQAYETRTGSTRDILNHAEGLWRYALDNTSPFIHEPNSLVHLAAKLRIIEPYVKLRKITSRLSITIDGDQIRLPHRIETVAIGYTLGDLYVRHTTTGRMWSSRDDLEIRFPKNEDQELGILLNGSYTVGLWPDQDGYEYEKSKSEEEATEEMLARISSFASKCEIVV